MSINCCCSQLSWFSNRACRSSFWHCLMLFSSFRKGCNQARRVANPVDLNLDAVQWVIDGRRGKSPLPVAKIWERMQTENLSEAVLFRELDVVEEGMVALFELAIEQRQPALRSALFREKPRAMPDAGVRRFKEVTGCAAPFAEAADPKSRP